MTRDMTHWADPAEKPEVSEVVRTVWEDPPPRGIPPGKIGRWAIELAPLVENPGRWARIADKDSASKAASLAGSLRNRTVRIPEPTGQWEVVSRTLEFGVHAVYARYLGERE